MLEHEQQTPPVFHFCPREPCVTLLDDVHLLAVLPGRSPSIVSTALCAGIVLIPVVLPSMPVSHRNSLSRVTGLLPTRTHDCDYLVSVLCVSTFQTLYF